MGNKPNRPKRATCKAKIIITVNMFSAVSRKEVKVTCNAKLNEDGPCPDAAYHAP